MELTPGYKRTDVGVVPEAWSLTSLGSLFAFSNGFNAAKSAYGRGTPFINVLEPISYSHIHGPEIPGRVEMPESLESVYSVRSGDMVFNRTSETDAELGLAAVYLGGQPVTFGGFVIRGRPTGDMLDPVYAGYALRAPAVRGQIVRMGQGAVRANIGQQSLRGVIVTVPPKPEQRAIAAALSDLDALVTSLEQLRDKKRQIKQGALQELLTGKKRLPGFNGDWDVSTVGCEFEVALGKMLDADKNVGIPKPYIGNRAVQWSRIDVADPQMMRIPSEELERYRLRRGDLLVCEGGEVGRAAIWDAPIEECYYQKALHRLRPIRGFCSQLMLAFLRHWSDTGVFADYSTQTSIAHLPRDKFLRMPLPRPSKPEQTAIAAVLADMDAEIEALEAQLEKTRAIKQGMMHELLTGRIRLV